VSAAAPAESTSRESELHLAAPSEDRRRQVLEALRRSRRLHRPWVYAPQTDAGYDRWLERQATDEFEGFLILRRSDDALVGICNLSQIIRDPLQGAFIGFGAVEGFAGRGYMRAGVALVLAQAFGRLRLHRVEANVQPGNTASRALVRSLGFVLEGYSERYVKVGGRWRDHERWALRAEIWRAMRRRGPRR
jgi:ribosomal-protein-alanine N-acetyltransferase